MKNMIVVACVISINFAVGVLAFAGNAVQMIPVDARAESYDPRQEVDFDCQAQATTGDRFHFTLMIGLSNAGSYEFASTPNDASDSASGGTQSMQAFTKSRYGQPFGVSNQDGVHVILLSPLTNAALEMSSATGLPPGQILIPSLQNFFGTTSGVQAIKTAANGSNSYLIEKMTFTGQGAAEGTIIFSGQLSEGSCTSLALGHECAELPSSPKGLSYSGLCQPSAGYYNSNPLLPHRLVPAQ